MSDPVFPVEAFTEWLTPVLREKTPGVVAQMEQEYQTGIRVYSEINPRKINNYYCEKGHKTVTIDRAEQHHTEKVPCSICSKEARSVSYFCDQKENPTHEFYKPKQVMSKKFKKGQRGQLRDGAYAYKKIYDDEKPRFAKRIKITL